MTNRDPHPTPSAPDIRLFEKQRHHPRFGPMVAAAEPFPLSWMEGSVVDVFEIQARCHGLRVALQDERQSLTYDDVNRWANRLAHRALRHDLPPNTIPIIMEKCCEAFVAALGLWKAGHSIMLVEPELVGSGLLDQMPPNSIAAIVTTRDVFAKIQSRIDAQVQVFFIEEMAVGEIDTNPGVSIAPEAPARLGFTSGSTGKRKFIMRTHRQRLFSARQYITAYCLGPHDRLGLFYSLSAAPTWSITLAGLLCGASVYLYDSTNPTPHALFDWLRLHEISMLSLPTVIFGRLMSVIKSTDPLPALRMIQVGGQPLHQREALRFQQYFTGGTILVCRYGMSEAGALTHFQIDPTTQIDSEIVPAGHTLPGRELFILDEQGKILGPGEVGEIGVASRFPAGWDEMEQNLTRVEGIRPDGGREGLFRTNDLGVLDAEGCLMHLGRKDDVVKVRGNRVSLVEVEHALQQIPGVDQAAVKAWPTPGGDNRLVGYVVPDENPDGAISTQDHTQNQSLNASYLHRALAQNGPSYLIPARFVFLDELPLLPAGKIDRPALPRPENPRPVLSTPYRAPTSEIETRLCTLWASCLELDQIGVDDDFFELGGDSVLMMGLLLTVEREWGQKVSPAFLLAPTIANLVVVLAAPVPSVEQEADIGIGENTRREAEMVPSAQSAPLDGAEQIEMGRKIPTRSQSWRERRAEKQARRRARQAPQQKDDASQSRLSRLDLARRLFEQGPILKGRALPYGIGVVLQRGLARLPATRRTYAPQLATLGAWHELLDDPTSLDEVIRAHLMGWTWRQWRATALLGNPTAFARWVRFEGQEALAAIKSAQHGVILATTHTSLRSFPGEIAHLMARPRLSINTGASLTAQEQADNNHPRRTARRTQQLMQAHELLQRNGVVTVTGDGRAGTGGVETRLGNRRIEIRLGAAELAATTGATLIPVFSQILPSGRIVIHLSPPIEPRYDNPTQPNTPASTLASTQTSVEAVRIATAFGQAFSAAWPQHYAAMSPNYLAMFLNKPFV